MNTILRYSNYSVVVTIQAPIGRDQSVYIINSMFHSAVVLPDVPDNSPTVCSTIFSPSSFFSSSDCCIRVRVRTSCISSVLQAVSLYEALLDTPVMPGPTVVRYQCLQILHKLLVTLASLSLTSASLELIPLSESGCPLMTLGGGQIHAGIRA